MNKKDIFMKPNLIITPDTKVAELLNAYPQLEEKLIEIVPVFNKLKNPILRRTIAKVTTLRQAAIIGKLQLSGLINKLRKEVHQDEIILGEQTKGKKEKPNWVKKENVKIEYNAIEDLESGIHPVNKVVKEVQGLSEYELYLLITNFIPAPLISMVEQKGFETFVDQLPDGNYGTYIKKIK